MFRPLGRRVLVRPTLPGDRKSGEIYLPDTAKKQNNEGVIIGVGPDVKSLHERELILFGKWIGVEVYLNNETFLLMSEDDILGVFCDPVFGQ
ncbi:co-chaperone GroES [candidate division TA06 bacterium]|nr:co-chaperone GroES [candidate division TA06 bacterium]